MEPIHDHMEGVETTGEDEPTVPLMSDDERRVLEIYDRLEVLQLEVALLRAQGILSRDSMSATSEEDIAAARHELLEAKAGFQLRCTVIENVLVANSTIKAVHAGSNASVVEQDLLPYIERRDDASVTLTKLSKLLSGARDDLIQAQATHIDVSRKNVELTATMCALAKDAASRKKEDIKDPKARRQLDDLEKSLKTSKGKWKMMKETASATVVGCGVDWARNPKLLEIVLDDERD